MQSHVSIANDSLTIPGQLDIGSAFDFIKKLDGEWKKFGKFCGGRHGDCILTLHPE
jgi:hypothetical protein